MSERNVQFSALFRAQSFGEISLGWLTVLLCRRRGIAAVPVEEFGKFGRVSLHNP